MKKLILIIGPDGVERDVVARILFETLERSAFLCRNWCWMVNPPHGLPKRHRKYIEQSYGYILDGYLLDPDTDQVIFSGPVEDQEDLDRIVAQPSYSDVGLYSFALVCDAPEFMRKKAAHQPDFTVAQADEIMARYHGLFVDRVIDMTEQSPEQAVSEILLAIEEMDSAIAQEKPDAPLREPENPKFI